jgi:thiol-disulfide isomerase/thioredoxin
MIRKKSITVFLYLLLFVILFLPDHVNAQSKDSFTVYVFLLDECRICQEEAPELNKIYENAKESGIGLIAYFPNYSTTEQGMEKFRKKYKVKYPIQTDHQKTAAKQFQATVLPECVVYNESTKEVIYRGAVNNRFYAPGKRRSSITQNYLKDVIFAIQSGKTPTFQQTEPIGCFINYSENPF